MERAVKSKSTLEQTTQNSLSNGKLSPPPFYPTTTTNRANTSLNTEIVNLWVEIIFSYISSAPSTEATLSRVKLNFFEDFKYLAKDLYPIELVLSASLKVLLVRL